MNKVSASTNSWKRKRGICDIWLEQQAEDISKVVTDLVQKMKGFNALTEFGYIKNARHNRGNLTMLTAPTGQRTATSWMQLLVCSRICSKISSVGKESASECRIGPALLASRQPVSNSNTTNTESHALDEIVLKSASSELTDGCAKERGCILKCCINISRWASIMLSGFSKVG